MTTTAVPTAVPTAAVPAASRTSDRALVAGALAGPTFCASAGVQMLTRDGFDITRHPISQLSTGSLGWIQIATFVLAGLGSVALAVGTRRTIREGMGRRALPILVGIFGVGLVAAGLFTMDPENGFPVGAPAGPAEMSWHGVVHSAAAAVAFTALAIAAIVLTVRCARRRRMVPAVLSGVAALVLLTPVSPDHMSIQIAVNGLVGFTWTTVLAVSLRRSA